MLCHSCRSLADVAVKRQDRINVLEEMIREIDLECTSVPPGRRSCREKRIAAAKWCWSCRAAALLEKKGDY